MKLLSIFLLLCSFQSFGQEKEDAEVKREVDEINFYVKYVDSISNHIEEEISDGEIVLSHGRIDGKPTRKIFTRTRIIKASNQIIRISYMQRATHDKELNLYFLDAKLVYAERNILRGKKGKSSISKFYYENEIDIYSTNPKNYPLEGIDVIVEAEHLVKQASR